MYSVRVKVAWKIELAESDAKLSEFQNNRKVTPECYCTLESIKPYNVSHGFLIC